MMATAAGSLIQLGAFDGDFWHRHHLL